jgi:hypothetical protein
VDFVDAPSSPAAPFSVRLAVAVLLWLLVVLGTLDIDLCGMPVTFTLTGQRIADR